MISVKKRFLSRKHDALKIQFEQLLEQNLDLILSNFLLHSILKMPDWSFEGLISVKELLLSRKHDAVQIQIEQLLEQILELILTNFLLRSILEMRDLEL